MSNLTVGTITSTSITSTSFTASSGITLPVFTNSTRPTGVNGLVIYNSESSKAEIYVDGNWEDLNAPQKGTLQNPITNSSETAGLASGAYYVQPSGYGGTVYQTYIDNNTLGGGWMLAWVVTNSNGSEVDWFAGDNWNGTGTGTDHFSTISVLNTSSLTALNKTNAKHPLFDYYQFSQMMIRENYNGTIGNKGYTLNATKSFREWFTDGSNPIDSNQSYSNKVSSIIGTSGTMGGTFYTDTLDFNYTLTNDGARMAATSVYQEATGGISAKVDNGRSYAWKGNLTRSDSNRFYNNSGITSDHTVWIFVR